jgi:hypothetical protein
MAAARAMDQSDLEEEEITAAMLRGKPRPLPISAQSAFSYIPPRRQDPKEHSYYYRASKVSSTRGGAGRGGAGRGGAPLQGRVLRDRVTAAEMALGAVSHGEARVEAARLWGGVGVKQHCAEDWVWWVCRRGMERGSQLALRPWGWWCWGSAVVGLESERRGCTGGVRLWGPLVDEVGWSSRQREPPKYGYYDYHLK